MKKQVKKLSVAQLLEQAKNYHGQNDWSAAKAAYEQILQQQPQHAEAYYLLGVIYAEQQELDKSLEYLQRAVDLAPNHADYHAAFGLALRRQGLLNDAVDHYKKALEINPQLTKLYSYLGNVYRDSKDYQQAEFYYQQAIAHGVTDVNSYLSLALVQKAQKKFSDALENLHYVKDVAPSSVKVADELVQCYVALNDLNSALTFSEAAVEQYPENSGLLNNHASLLKNLKQYDAAKKFYKQAIALQPQQTIYHYNLALTLIEEGLIDDAIKCLEQLIELEPNNIKYLIQLGTLYKNVEQSLGYFEKAVALAPNDTDCLYYYADALYRNRQYAEALTIYEKAIALRPDCSQFINNYGLVFVAQGNFETGRHYLEQAVAIDKQSSEAIVNLASVYYYLGDQAAMAQYCPRILKEQPENPHCHYLNAFYQFLLGNYPEGWREYESRWAVADGATIKLDLPATAWQGENLAQKTLLVWNEQGIGDEVMFAQCLLALSQQAKHLIYYCTERLLPLFQRSYPHIEFITDIKPIKWEGIDYQCSIGSAMGICYPNLADFPRYLAYLTADPSLTAQLRARYLGNNKKILVGFAWHSGNVKVGYIRTLNLGRWLSFFQLPHLQFVSLQYGDPEAVITEVNKKYNCSVIYDKQIDSLTNIDDFAAQIAAMDLVITIDNSTAHLAGALGKPVWVLLPFAPDWRWQFSGETTPWYPSAKLYRQTQRGNWESVISSVLHDLKRIKVDDNQKLK